MSKDQVLINISFFLISDKKKITLQFSNADTDVYQSNPRNSYTADLSLPPKFFTFSFEGSEMVYFHSSAGPEAAEVSF